MERNTRKNPVLYFEVGDSFSGMEIAFDAKHKDEIMASLEAMRKAGQMSDDQYRLAKARFGLK